jgi:predicted transcriptional regulator
MDQKSHITLDEADRQNDEIRMSETERQAFSAGVAEGIAQFARGEFVSLADVRKWVASWGSENELPTPSSKTRS